MGKRGGEGDERVLVSQKWNMLAEMCRRNLHNGKLVSIFTTTLLSNSTHYIWEKKRNKRGKKDKRIKHFSSECSSASTFIVTTGIKIDLCRIVMEEMTLILTWKGYRTLSITMEGPICCWLVFCLSTRQIRYKSFPNQNGIILSSLYLWYVCSSFPF